MAERGPYRVVVFGPGKMGGVAIWEVGRLPEFELVGVRAYNPEKEGLDAGELFGFDRLGVAVTTDLQTALAIDCDCVIYTGRDTGDDNTDAEIVEILDAGRNVVTPIPYNNAALWREAQFVATLEDACARGGATFHSTGMDPDLISERIALALTGMCTDLKQLTIRETWPCDGLDPVLLQIVGFGMDPAEAAQQPFAAAISRNVLYSVGRSAEHALGVVFDRVKESHLFAPSPVAMEKNGIVVEPGTVGRATHRFEGWVDAKGTAPFFVLELNWYMDEANLPERIGAGDYWVVEMEGTPSARMVIDLRASLEHEDRFYEIGRIRTDPGYHGTIAAVLQSIPFVCSAAPGVLPSFEAPLHWKQDLRDLAGRAMALSTHSNQLEAP